MGRLNQYFTREEFACKCGCGFNTVDTELLKLLTAARAHFNKPITITSACRCEAHNERVGGSPNSLHKLGRAADIIVKDVDPADVAHFFDIEFDAPGVGEYNTFTHVDSRTGRARWCGNA